MGLFGKNDPQKTYDAFGFTVTKTLFDPPAATMMPCVYADEPALRWSVKYPLVNPTFFEYSDILACEVVEDKAKSVPALQSGKGRFASIVSNPDKVSRLNAEARGMCFGLAVIVVMTSGEKQVKLQLPVITRKVRKGSSTYESGLRYAEELRDEFLKMKGLGEKK